MHLPIMKPHPYSDVSVIIPTHNRLEFLQEALASVWDQSSPALEVIVIDDGSNDGTASWIQTQHREGLIYFRQDQAGPAAARNRGAKLARGNYLAFLDSDDCWLPKKLAVQQNFMARHPEFRFCQTEEIWIRDGVRVNPHKKHQKPSGWVFETCLPLCLISPSAVMLEREFFLELGGFDVSLPVCEDYDLWLRASLRSPMQTLDEKLVMKRGGHADQLSRRYPAMDQFRVQSMLKVLQEEKLNSRQTRALLKELNKKLQILLKGFEKRYPQEINPYQEKFAWLQKNYPVESVAADSNSETSKFELG